MSTSSPLQLLDAVSVDVYVPIGLALKIAEDCKKMLHSAAPDGTASPATSDAISALRTLSRRLAADINLLASFLPPQEITAMSNNNDDEEADIARRRRSLSPKSHAQQQALLNQLVGMQKSAAAAAAAAGNKAADNKNSGGGWRDSSTERSGSSVAGSSDRGSIISSSSNSFPRQQRHHKAATGSSASSSSAAAAAAGAVAVVRARSPSQGSSVNEPFPANPSDLCSAFHNNRNGSRHRSALSEKKRVLGLVLNNLACALFLAGDEAVASATLTQAAQLEKEATVQHQAALSTLGNLVAMCNAKGDFVQAQQVGLGAMQMLDDLVRAQRQQEMDREYAERAELIPSSSLTEGDEDENDEDDNDDDLSVSSKRGKNRKQSATTTATDIASSYSVSALRYNYSVAVIGAQLQIFSFQPSQLCELLETTDARGLTEGTNHALKQLRRARDDCIRIVKREKMKRELNGEEHQKQEREPPTMSADERACRNLIARIDTTIQELVVHAEQMQDLRREVLRREEEQVQQRVAEDVAAADEALDELLGSPSPRKVHVGALPANTTSTSSERNLDQQQRRSQKSNNNNSRNKSTVGGGSSGKASKKNQASLSPLSLPQHLDFQQQQQQQQHSRFPPIRGASKASASSSPPIDKMPQRQQPAPQPVRASAWINSIIHSVEAEDDALRSAKAGREGRGGVPKKKMMMAGMKPYSDRPQQSGNLIPLHLRQSASPKHQGRFVLPSSELNTRN